MSCLRSRVGFVPVWDKGPEGVELRDHEICDAAGTARCSFIIKQ